MSGVITVLILAILGASILCGGIHIIAGAGWALACGGALMLAGSYVVSRGLGNGG